MAAEKISSEEVQNDYDAVPYISYPYFNTHPEHLYTIGNLFGMEAASPSSARVLELGCASGGNIIPMAIKFPEADFVGVDYSTVQIDEANKHKEKLGLKNVEFKGVSISDIDESFGKFDYIAVHGILSWVPKDIQDKIFEVCDKNLSDNGIAYISYNTLPGWGIVRSIREMMLYHTDKFTNPADKIREARMLLNFIKHGNGLNSETAYTKFIQSEIDTLSTCSDSYLIHDHLEENNEPFYFHEFMSNAHKNNLQYLGDAAVATMFIGNFPKETAEVLKKVGNDIVKAEQYMDFIRNRRFRSTLLCKKDIKINRTIKGEKLKDFYLSTGVKPVQDVSKLDFTADQTIDFRGSKGNEFKVRDKYLLAALLCLCEKSCAVNANDLLQDVAIRLGSLVLDNQYEEKLLNSMLVLVFSGNIDLSSAKPSYVDKISEKPEVSELARYQATYTDWVTNEVANKVTVDLFGRALLQHLNGENSFDDIVANMKKHVVSKELNIKEDGKVVTDEKVIEEKLRELINISLQKMLSSGLLIG